MTKTYCDRCGQEIPKQKAYWLRQTTYYCLQRLVPACMRDDWTDLGKCICPDCAEQYDAWFRAPKENRPAE